MSDPAAIYSVPDPWETLRGTTSARIALGRAGGSLPTGALLDFRRAHALARDAVHRPFDANALARAIGLREWDRILAQSAAPDRLAYLKQPDLGRRLSLASRDELLAIRRPAGFDLVIIAADGLSAAAAHAQIPGVLCALVPRLLEKGWRLAPLILVRLGRVAIQDEIGHLFDAAFSLILLGERPGLGNADSLGAYFVRNPGPGRTDADRNCVSNIRAEGLTPEAAAEKLVFLLNLARARGLSGVGLKDESGGDTELLLAPIESLKNSSSGAGPM